MAIAQTCVCAVATAWTDIWSVGTYEFHIGLYSLRQLHYSLKLNAILPMEGTNTLFVCGVSLTSGQLFRALSRLPQGSAF